MASPDKTPRCMDGAGDVCGECVECVPREELEAEVVRLQQALREGETLLTNYLVAGKFPPGSDCEAVRDMFVAVLVASPDKPPEPR